MSVDSPAFVFSPGNWTGDEGRNGKTFRQTWYNSAYFRVTWKSAQNKPTARLLLDTAVYYNPDKPADACLEQGGLFALFLQLLLSFILAFGSWFVMTQELGD